MTHTRCMMVSLFGFLTFWIHTVDTTSLEHYQKIKIFNTLQNDWNIHGNYDIIERELCVLLEMNGSKPLSNNHIQSWMQNIRHCFKQNTLTQCIFVALTCQLNILIWLDKFPKSLFLESNDAVLTIDLVANICILRFSLASLHIESILLIIAITIWRNQFSVCLIGTNNA